MADNDEKEMRNGSAPGTTVTGNQLLVAVIFLHVVIVWLFLAARIIWSATSNPEPLQTIEGLLTALAVLTIPVSMGLNEMFKAFSNESAKKDE